MLKRWVRSLKRDLPVVVVLCLGVLISFCCFAILRSLEAEKADAAFQQVAQERIDELQSDLNLTVSRVVALGAFCESSYPVTRASFNSFVQPLLSSSDPAIRALEWAPRVDGKERASFEKSVRASGIADFEIRDSKARRIVPAAERNVYFPILYVLPLAGNQIATGFDGLASNTPRLEAITRAISSGKLTASSRLTVVQGTPGRYGILIFRPVFRPGRGASVLAGFAEGVLEIGDVIEKHGAGSGVALELTDLSAKKGEQQLYISPGSTPQASHLARAITVGGRNWQITASPMPGAFPVSNGPSYAGFISCLLFTLLAAVYVGETSGTRRKIERVVEERTGALNSALNSLEELHRGLEESEARYRRFVEDSPGAIVVERQGKIVLANRAAVEMFSGFDATQNSEGYTLLEFVAPDKRAAAEEVIQRLYAQDMNIPPTETRLLRRDGSIIDAEVVASSFLQDGQRNIQVVFRDISQRKQEGVENARLVRAIEQAAESIMILDLDRKIVYANPAFERITGYSRAEALGRDPAFLRAGQLDSYSVGLWDQVRSGDIWSGRLINRSKDGRIFIEEATVSPVLDRSGTIINFVTVKRDVTLETELQEKLHQSQKMDAIGRLAGGVAHDFNNMLMVIVSYAELIADALPEDNQLRDHTEQILRAAERSTALTRQLLAFSRKQVLTLQILDCNKIVTETSSMVRRLISENIELKCELDSDLWTVKADADQIAQVILNLCVNSRDAMPNGGSLVLRTRNYPVDQGFVNISVSDTGIGISHELQANLFEPFFTTKERGKGTGLGLATVYGIVQQSGGQIHVESSPGHGATFTISLPRCMEAAPPPEPRLQSSLVAGCGLVMLVEDEEGLREAIAENLRNHGYRVLVASDGIEALDILMRNPEISILVSDLIMPRMGGRELARLAIRQLPHLRIIFMSGYANHEFTLGDHGQTPEVYLQKPFPMERLMTRIAEFNANAEELDSDQLSLDLGQLPHS